MFDEKKPLKRIIYDHSHFMIAGNLVVIYVAQQAFKLSGIHAKVWSYIDGKRTINDISADADIEMSVLKSIIEKLLLTKIIYYE